MYLLFLGFIYSPNLYVGLHIQPTILPLHFVIWAIYTDQFLLWASATGRTYGSVFWAIYMFHFIQVFLIFWALYTVHFSWFFLSSFNYGLYMWAILCLLVCFLGYICSPLSTSAVRGFYGAKIGVAHWGYGASSDRSVMYILAQKEYFLGLWHWWMRQQAGRG